MDPEVAELVRQLGGTSAADILTIGGTQTGVFGVIVWSLLKRARRAEELLEHIGEALEHAVARERAQHRHNRWSQEAITLIVRRIGEMKGVNGGDADADALNLSRPRSTDD